MVPPTGVSFAGTTITADYGATNGNLEPGATVVLRFRAVIAPALAIGTRITNTGVVTWNNPPQTASASVSIDIGGMPGVGVLNGTAWHDTDFDDTLDTGERPLEGWTVELYRDGELVFSTVTDAAGVYRISGLPPNYLSGEVYELRFLAPGAVATTAALGRADSDFTNYMQRITDIVVQPGANLQNLNLPIDPNGVVYNSITRAPIAGAVLTLLDAGSGAALPASCFDDPAHQNQVTLASGWYKFEINFNDPACPSGGSYLIGVSVPGGGYVAGYSQFIPPISGPATAPFAVPSCPASANDAIAATAQHCEVQVSEFAPADVGAGAQRRDQSPRAPDARRHAVARLEPALQQPPAARSDARRRSRHQQDDADAERHARPAGALHHYGAQPVRDRAPRCHDRRSLPGGLRLRRGIRSAGRRGGGAHGFRSRARLGWSHAVGLRRAQAPAAARRGCRCNRGRVRQPRSGVAAA